MSASSSPAFRLRAWLVFFGLVLALLFLDLFVFHREAKAVSFKESERGSQSRETDSGAGASYQ